MLAEADDPEAKLALPGSVSPSIHMLTLDGHTDSDSSEGDEQENAALISQDPPPSYIDVQSFRSRAKEEQEAELVSRVRRRFALALLAGLLLVALPLALSLTIRFSSSSQNDNPTDTKPTHPNRPPPPPPPDSPPWRNRPGPPGGDWDRGGGWGPDHGGRGGPPGPPPDEGRRGPNRGQRPEHPPPEDSEGQGCSSEWLPNTDIDAGQDPSFVTTFPIPLNSTISIRSFLSQATGTLRVSLDEGLHDTGSIQVIANGVTQKNLNQIGACLVTNKGRYFNTLFLKPKGFAAEVATYSIHLRFPSREASYPGLITDLPGFAQSFDDLSIARFDFIEAGGMDGSIDALSILAKFIIVRSYNGTVDGHFSAEKGLTIHGEFSPITITSNICDDGWAFPTFARISTYQSPIDARLTLCNHTTAMEDESYGRYLVDVSNSDSPIALQIEHTYPVQGSSLYVNVTNIERERTGASHVMVTLDTGFEGNFELRADGDKALPPSVKSEEATDDHGGFRNVEINRVENEQRLIGGKVYWDSPVPPLDRRGSGVRINTFGSGEASLTLLGD